MKTLLNIAGKKCIIYADEQPQVILIQPLGEHEQTTLEAEIDAIHAAVQTPFVFAGLEISDWEKELTPWHDPNISTSEEIGSHSFETLDYIIARLMPYLFAHYATLPVVLGGYSLAGLFARWAACKTECFDAVAAASPSLWITGWKGFSDAHEICARYVYLSLGDREEFTRNKALAQVGDTIRWEYEHLQRTIGPDHCTLVWEKGGHFANPHIRLARAFVWCIQSLTYSLPSKKLSERKYDRKT
ncbi:MAG: esterase [Paludibacteraceae bacterium]|nr:esterase [Paludibacteraceae bacterium]